jgi:tRNA-2-methylthio-N6-dimethylallyladenosine synthase
MNVADSEKMLSSLQAENYSLTLTPDDADLIVLNTCHIREKARHKVLSRLGVLQHLKSKNKNLKIAVAGCVAQADGKKLLELAPQIDILLGPGKISDLSSLIKQNSDTKEQAISVGFDRHTQEAEDHALASPSVSGKKEVTRFVNIIQGCNNFCTFCVVPFTRGREISRPQDDVLREVSNLVAAGAKEVTLLGQNVNSYGLDLLGVDIVPDDGGPFVKLLEAVSKIEGLERLRFTTSNPHDFTSPLADLFKVQPKLGSYIHLPVQAGSDRTLERMKRKVTVAEYLERIQWIKSSIPDAAISTDIIVGFPGETEEEFQDTLTLLDKVKFSFVYAFKYSSRKFTAAARFADHISESVMTERLARLNALQDKITNQQVADEIGRTRDVLFIYESKKEPGLFIGKTQHYRTVRVRSDVDLVGLTMPVEILSGNKIALVGRVVH